MTQQAPVGGVVALDLSLPGHQLRWLASKGARFCLPRGHTKGQDAKGKPTLPKGWQNTPQTLEQAIQHTRNGGNVGLLTGTHSGGIVALDRDADFPATVEVLGNLAHTVRIQRDNAPDRGKLLYRVKGAIPKPAMWKRNKTDKHPEAELLTDGRHAVAPPSEFNGGRYLLAGTEYGILEVTPAELDAIWFLVTGAHLDDGKATRQDGDNEAQSNSEYIRRVKDAWPTREVFNHWKKDTNGAEDERDETRLLGNGGLLVNDWRWYCHADGCGGDQVDAWHWCETGKSLDRTDAKGFWRTVNAMAAAAGIPQPEPAHRNGNGNGAGCAHLDGDEQADPADLDTDGDKPKKRSIFDKIKADFASWGYGDLWLSDMDESIWLGGSRFTDADRARLRMTARNASYGKFKLMGALDDAIMAYAAERRRHPVREYFSTLQWDGKDHIAALARHFTDSHAPIKSADGSRRRAFHAALLRWLVGAVAKQMGDGDAARSNFILVLSGAQDAGKSHFARWLCPLPSAFVERHITPGDKDCSLQRTRTLVWEIMELGATTRRADVEALKAHITQATVTERAAYGHFDTVRPAVASYIGTVNPDGGGFLNDTTGNRRFAVIDVVSIDWQYSTAVDVHQVWAQALELWRVQPKAYRMATEERGAFDSNAAEHMEPDVFADALARVYDIDAGNTEKCCTSTEILDTIRAFGGISRGHDKAQAREVARALKAHWGIVGRRSNGKTVYDGIERKTEYRSQNGGWE